jgi:hypothetical protein
MARIRRRDLSLMMDKDEAGWRGREGKGNEEEEEKEKEDEDEDERRGWRREE